MTNEKKQKRNALQQFLLQEYFGNKKDEYETIEVNGFVLVKQIHGITGKSIVAVYSLENYQKMKKFWQNPLFGEGEHIHNIMQE